MNYENIFTRSVLLLSIVACSGEKEAVNRIQFVSTPDQTQKLNEADYHWVDASLQTDACKFLGSKRIEHPEDAKEDIKEPGISFTRFQLYQSIFAQDGIIMGSHAVAKLPQILFTLSGEAAESGGTMYKSYDPVSFYRLAKKELCPKIPTYCDKLIKHDQKQDLLDGKQQELVETLKAISKLEAELNQAHDNGEYDSARSISVELTQKRVYSDSLRIEIKRTTSEVETLDVQVDAAEETQREAATTEQIEALDNIKSLIYAIANWEERWNSAIGSHFVSVQKAYTKARNKQIETIINRRAPGALDGQHGDLIDSDLFVMYLRYLKTAMPSEDAKGLVERLSVEIDSLRPILTSELSLFNDPAPKFRSWIDFERDVANVVALLAIRPTGIEDATCKFVLSQRLIAQIISIKGIRQSPAVTSEGYLQALQVDPKHEVEHDDVAGVFKTVVDEGWLQKALNSPGQESPVPYGTMIDDRQMREVYPIEYFAWIRALAHIVSSANSPFWIKVKAAPAPEELIPGDLLKLSFGMMAVGLQAMQTHFLQVETPNVHIIPEDSAEAFASLVQANIESLRAFDAQFKMHQQIPDLAFLDDKQLSSIKPNGDKKMLLLNLLYAANKGAIRFYNMDSTSPSLKLMLQSSINRSGVYLKNESLYQFAFEGPRDSRR